MKWFRWMPGGRPKQFNENEILEEAMQLFWGKGYHQVSVRDIEKRTGIKSQSLYNHFGDKEGIFIGTIEHYVETRLSLLIDKAKNESDPDKAVTLLVEHFRESSGRSVLSGCFLANAIVDLGSNPQVKKLFDDSFGLLTQTIEESLNRKQNFTPSLAESRAATITNSIIGLAVSSCSRPTQAHIDTVYRGIMELTEAGVH